LLVATATWKVKSFG